MTDFNVAPEPVEPVEKSKIPFGEVPELPQHEATTQSQITEKEKKNANTATWVIILLLALLVMIICTCCGVVIFAGGIRSSNLNRNFNNLLNGMELYIPLFAGLL